jgi:peroxiredoxin
LADLKVKNVDEVWCVSLNDGYVGRLGREQKAIGKVRMLETATGDQEARPRG